MRIHTSHCFESSISIADDFTAINSNRLQLAIIVVLTDNYHARNINRAFNARNNVLRIIFFDTLRRSRIIITGYNCPEVRGPQLVTDWLRDMKFT